MTKASYADRVCRLLLRDSGAGPARARGRLLVGIGVAASMALCPAGEARAQRAGALGTAGSARGSNGIGTASRAPTLGPTGLGTTGLGTTGLGTRGLGAAAPSAGTTAPSAGTAPTSGTAAPRGTTTATGTTTTTAGTAAPTNPATGTSAPAGTAQAGVGIQGTLGSSSPAGMAPPGPSGPAPSSGAGTTPMGSAAGAPTGSGPTSGTPSGSPGQPGGGPGKPGGGPGKPGGSPGKPGGSPGQPSGSPGREGGTGTAPSGTGTSGHPGTTSRGHGGPHGATPAKTPAIAPPTGDPAAAAAAPPAGGLADDRGRADGVRQPGLPEPEDDTRPWFGGVLPNLLWPDAPSRSSRLEQPAGSASPPDDTTPPPDTGGPELRRPSSPRPRAFTAPPVQASKVRTSRTLTQAARVARPFRRIRTTSRPVPAVQARPDLVPDEVLLELQPRLSEGAIGAVASRYGLTEIGAQRIGLLSTTIYRCRIPRGQSVGTILQRLRGDQRVAVAQPNGKFRLQDDAAPSQRLADRPPVRADTSALQWSAERLGLPAIHRRTTGLNVPIAMIDSGIDTAHPELRGGDIERLNVLDTPYTSQVHGTEIAGALSSRGQLTGVAPGSRILGIRAFDATAAQMGAEGTSIHIAEALDLADRKGAKVLNLSFAGPEDSLLHRMFAALHAKGVVIVAAAGNAGPTSPPLYPAADPTVIAVTATDAKDALYRLANRGPYISVAAPGVDVLEPAPGATYQLTTGTSVAAAQVSGIAALLLALDPALDPDGLRKLLTETADPEAEGRQPDSFGAGLVDAVRAMDRVKPVSPAVPPPAAPSSAPVPEGATAGTAASSDLRKP